MAGQKSLATSHVAPVVAALSLGVALAAFIVAALYVYPCNGRQSQASAVWADETRQVITAINTLLVSSINAEAAQRGFLLTGDVSLLGLYNDAVASVRHEFSALQLLTVSNPGQQTRLKMLGGQVEGELAYLASSIEHLRDGDRNAAVETVRSGNGKVFMDAIHGTATAMVADAEQMLRVRQFEAMRLQQAANETGLLLATFGVISILIGCGAIITAVGAAGNTRRATATALDRLRLLNDLDLAPIMMRDLDGTIRLWSEGYHRLYGWTAEQAIGQSVHSLLETEYPVSQEEFNNDLLTKREWSGELRRRTRDGSNVTVLAHKRLAESIDGRKLSVMETGSDVTEARRLEADLRGNEARLHLFIENAPVGIAMFDNAMRYIAVSRRFVSDSRLDDQTPATLIGRCYYDLFPVIADHWRDAHRRVLAGETLASGKEPFQLADSHLNWARWQMSPWRNADGSIGGALLFTEDTTDRKAAEAALRDNEARLRLVQRVGGIAYFDRILSEEASTISEEFTRLVGLPPGQTQLTRPEILALVHPDDREWIASTTQLTLAHSGKLAGEFRIIRTDGVLRWIGVQIEIFPGPDGQPYRIIAALRDITEIVRAREVLAARHDDLERSNADLEEFAYTVAHDLKAPLRAIGHLTDWIGEDFKDSATLEAAQNLALLKSRVLRMQDLLAGLLVYSRVGQIDRTTEDVAVADVVSDIVSMQGIVANFAVTYEGEQIILRTQRVALQVVLENLIGNAVKHHDRPSGRIVVSTQRVDGLVEFRVADDGPGVAESCQLRVFGIFQTLRSRDDQESSGIGLAIVKRKVESHGGRIWIESAPPVRGATFVFTWKPITE